MTCPETQAMAEERKECHGPGTTTTTITAAAATIPTLPFSFFVRVYAASPGACEGLATSPLPLLLFSAYNCMLPPMCEIVCVLSLIHI